MKRRDFICPIGATALSIPRTGYAQTKTDLPLVAFLLLPKPETTLAKERISAAACGKYGKNGKFSASSLGRKSKCRASVLR